MKSSAPTYEAVQPAEKTKRQFAADVLQRVFDGSAKELMLHALASRRSSKNEIEEPAACSTNTKGQADERVCQLVYSGSFAHAGFGATAFSVAGRSLGGLGSRCVERFAPSLHALRHQCPDAGIDDCRASHHLFRTEPLVRGPCGASARGICASRNSRRGTRDYISGSAHRSSFQFAGLVRRHAHNVRGTLVYRGDSL
jgi:hypothetical protein